MGGKLPLIGVVVVGLLAAVCAAILMAALRAAPADAAAATDNTVDVLVAAADIPPMTPLTEDLLEVRAVPKADAPKDRFGDPVQVIGRALRTPIISGQAIAPRNLLPEDSGARLASSLPPGLRAVGIELPTSSAMRGLLYPGSRVDVVVSYKPMPGSRRTGPMSETLLQNVRVLAVEQETVFSHEEEPEDGEEPASPAFNANARTLMVTLMVDPQQARELQAARDLGVLSLSMRNPLDESLTADPEVIEAEAIAEVEAMPEEPEVWETVVIRGGASPETRTFGKPAPAEGETESDQYATVPVDREPPPDG